MMTTFNSSRCLRASILDRGQCDPLEYDEAFRFWRSEWQKAIDEQKLEGLSVRASDKFVHADRVLVLRYRDEIAGLGLITHIDLDFEADQNIAYLSAMPDEAHEFMRKHGVRRIVASGYNIVQKRFRRATSGRTLISIALPGIVLALFERQSQFDLCMGMPLIATGNHTTLARLGMVDMHANPFYIHETPAKFMCSLQHEVDLGKYASDIDALARQAAPELFWDNPRPRHLSPHSTWQSGLRM